MAYYHDIITEQSWQELQRLKRNVDFVLIGGWAAYLYTHSLKSKDIDIVIDYDQLRDLRRLYACCKNERLKKYEAVKEEVQIDIYVPHYSELGIPVEDLIRQTTEREGFTVLKLPYLVALKIYTLSQRARSSKGRKDFIDIMALLQKDDSAIQEAGDLLYKYQLMSSLDTLFDIATERKDLPELNLNAHGYSVVRKKLEQLRGIVRKVE